MYLLASLKDSPGLGGAYETNRRGGEENPVYGRNTTVNVDKIRGFRPPYVWTKTFVFLLTLDRESTDRCFLYACYGNPLWKDMRMSKSVADFDEVQVDTEGMRTIDACV